MLGFLNLTGIELVIVVVIGLCLFAAPVIGVVLLLKSSNKQAVPRQG